MAVSNGVGTTVDGGVSGGGGEYEHSAVSFRVPLETQFWCCCF